MMWLLLFSICVFFLYWKILSSPVERWEDHYRVGWRPSWLPSNYPEARFVDWSNASPSLWAEQIERPVHLVATMMSLRPQLRTLFGGRLAENLDRAPVMVQAAALTFHGLRMLASPISTETAFEWALLLHFEEGVAESRSAVVSSLVEQYGDLFEVPMPPIVAPYLNCVAHKVRTTVTPLPVERQAVRPRRATTGDEEQRKNQ